MCQWKYKSRDTEVQKLNIDTTSGNARVSGSFERVELNTISGKIKIQSSEMLQSFKSSSVSGDVTLLFLKMMVSRLNLTRFQVILTANLPLPLMEVDIFTKKEDLYLRLIQ